MHLNEKRNKIKILKSSAALQSCDLLLNLHSELFNKKKTLSFLFINNTVNLIFLKNFF